MGSPHIIELSSDNFENKVVNAKGRVLVDFWAEWCGPCKMIAPLLDEIADEFTDKITIGKVDIDKNSDLAQKYGIAAIPTMLVFTDGEVSDKIVGMQSKAKLVEKLELAG